MLHSQARAVLRLWTELDDGSTARGRTGARAHQRHERVRTTDDDDEEDVEEDVEGSVEAGTQQLHEQRAPRRVQARSGKKK